MPKCYLCSKDHNKILGFANFFYCARCGECTCKKHNTKQHYSDIGKAMKVCPACYKSYPKSESQLNKLKQVVAQNDITLIMHDHDKKHPPGNSLVYDFLTFCKDYNVVLALEGGYIEYDYLECVTWFCRTFGGKMLEANIAVLIQGFLVLPIGSKRLLESGDDDQKRFNRFSDTVKIYSFDSARSDPNTADLHLQASMKQKMLLGDELKSYHNQVKKYLDLEREEKLFLSHKFGMAYRNELITSKEKQILKYHDPNYDNIKKSKSPHHLIICGNDRGMDTTTVFEHSRYLANRPIAQRLYSLYHVHCEVNRLSRKQTKLIVICGAAHEVTQQVKTIISQELKIERKTISKWLLSHGVRVGVINCVQQGSVHEHSGLETSAYMMSLDNKPFWEYPT
ncbi:MAG: hypothetical protein GY750_09425 [Lentisphaerae bacterium]|nr:hypothetical protein [Lentisphaerota bacterium]MCP4101632.1 hypothetical protein [Lentisphaerota bacterium]